MKLGNFRGDQSLNITKGAAPAFSLSIQRLCYVIGEHIFDNYANTSDITIDGW